MSIQTFDGLMKQASADIPELTGEDLEAFKKSHRGMTPREYSIQYLKYTIVYSYRNLMSKLLSECITRNISFADVYKECTETKSSKLPSSVRRLVTTFGKTETGMSLMTEIVNEQIKALADRAVAEPVAKLIDAIGTVDDSEECKNRVDEARKAYDALDDDKKRMVFRYKLLVDAEKKLSGEDEFVENQDAECVSDVIVDEKEADEDTNE